MVCVRRDFFGVALDVAGVILSNRITLRTCFFVLSRASATRVLGPISAFPSSFLMGEISPISLPQNQFHHSKFNLKAVKESKDLLVVDVIIVLLDRLGKLFDCGCVWIVDRYLHSLLA